MKCNCSHITYTKCILLNILISIAVFFLGIFALPFCNERENRTDSITNMKQLEQLLELNAKNKKDSANNEIHDSKVLLAILNYIQENSFSDFREETDYIINKYNGLLALWIAIITVVGGIIPWVVFFRTEDKQEKKFKEYQIISKEILDAQEKRITKINNELKLENAKNQIINTVYGITSATNPSIVASHNYMNRTSFTRLYLNELKDSLQIFNNEISKAAKENYNFSKDLILVLLQIQWGLIKARPIYHEKFINKHFLTTEEKIKNLLNNIDFLKKEETIEQLKDIYTLMQALCNKVG